MTTNVHPYVLRASRFAVFLIEGLEFATEVLFAVLEKVLIGGIELLFWILSNSHQRARQSAAKRNRQKQERELEKKRRDEFVWRARESAKAMRDYGPKSSGGFFSKLCSLLTWALILFVTFKVVLPHVLG